MVSQVGRPDDGTDTTGFFNTEYFIDLKPKEQWRPVFRQNKEELIAAMDRELEKIPGALWNFSQPIADNMEEAVSGVKGQLAIKIYGDDLKTLEAKGDEIVNVMRTVPGVADLGLFRVIGQPNLEFEVDRAKAARYGINVSDVQDAIETAVGGKAVTPGTAGRAALRPGGALSGAVPHTKEAIENIRLVCALRRARFARLNCATCAFSMALRRFIAKGIRATSRSSTASSAAIWAARWKKPSRKVTKQVKLPPGYHIDWAGEYESAKRSQKRLMIVVPDNASGDLHDPLHHVQFVQMGAADYRERGHGAHRRVAGAAAHRNALQRFFGRRISCAVRRFGSDRRHHARVHQSAARPRANRSSMRRSRIRPRLRPIMMTMLVASVGLLPAALSRGIGSDSQRPFAIVIVGGLVAALILGVFLLPTLYVWVAGDRDVMPATESEFQE